MYFTVWLGMIHPSSIQYVLLVWTKTKSIKGQPHFCITMVTTGQRSKQHCHIKFTCIVVFCCIIKRDNASSQADSYSIKSCYNLNERNLTSFTLKIISSMTQPSCPLDLDCTEIHLCTSNVWPTAILVSFSKWGCSSPVWTGLFVQHIQSPISS